MKKFIFYLFMLVPIYSVFCQTEKSEVTVTPNFLSIVVKDMSGKEVKLSKYYGSVVLIVNVASECGNTPQYKGLQNIYEKYKEKGFEILAFPCNDFGKQEPGSNEEIMNFCTTEFGVTFQLFNKIKVLGKDKEPLYKLLTDNPTTGKTDIEWNFEKFLISKEGDIVKRYGPKVQPESDELINDIELHLSM